MTHQTLTNRTGLYFDILVCAANSALKIHLAPSPSSAFSDGWETRPPEHIHREKSSEDQQVKDPKPPGPVSLFCWKWKKKKKNKRACPCASGNAPQPCIVPLARAGNSCSTQGKTLHTVSLKAMCWLKDSTNTEIYHNTSKQDRTVARSGLLAYHLLLRTSFLSSSLLTQQCHTWLRERCWSRARYRNTFLWFHGWCSTHL